MNNDNLIQGLEEHFEATQNEKDHYKFHSSVINYFKFINETYPFNDLIKTILLSNSKKLDVLSNVEKIYRHYILNDDKYKDRGTIDTLTLKVVGLSFLHKIMIEKTQQIGLENKKTIVLNNSKNNKSIYLMKNPLLCYSFKSNTVHRLEIVSILLKTKTPKNVSEVVKLLHKDETNKDVQSYIKKEITAINKLFKQNCDPDRNLITTVKLGGKNTYSLNRDNFNFERNKK